MKLTIRQMNVLKIYCLKNKLREQADFLQEVMDECFENKLKDYDFQGLEDLLKIVKQLEANEQRITDRRRLSCVRN